VATKTAAKKQAKPAKKHAPARPVHVKKAVHKAKPAAKTAAAVKPAAKAHKVIKVKPAAKTAAKPAAKPALKAVPTAPQPLAKANGKIPAKVASKAGKPGEDTPGDADSPLLDMSDVGVRKMIAKAKTRGYVTYDELNKVLPSDKVSSEQIEDTMALLNEMGINVIESEEQEEGADENLPAVIEGGKEVVAKTGTAAEQYDRTDDPVRMYLREMGSVELLSREGEIAIAKRIEAGRELMIGALCESPLTFEALTVWRDELNEGKVLLRDIIDLEAMYAVGPEGQAAAAAQAASSAAHLANINAAAAGLPRPVPPPPPPKPAPAPRPQSENGEEQDPAEAAAQADAADADDFDDEGNLPLSAMEATLKPQVLEALDAIAALYKKLGRLQDASVEAALASDELSTGQERRFKKLRNETMDLV